MPRVLPQFVPILTSFAGRVSGRNLGQLLSSGAGLARALLDTQKVVGHDGVLCLFHTPLMAEACAESSSGPLRLRASEDVPRFGKMPVLLDAVRALRRQLPPHAMVFATFAGPSLLLSDLTKRQSGGDAPDSDYAGDVFLGMVRAAFDSEAQGIAVVEERLVEISPEVASTYRSANKLAEFYGAAQMVFHLPGAPGAGASTGAHCSFFLESGGDPCRLVAGTGAAGEPMPATTAGDVPADIALDRIKGLREQVQSSGR
jgi:hypothetical protein